ncbi:CRISPR-associated protein [Methanosarcina sp.]|uniref:CRISPR-associated protein n=1 Tax=Methanosarcina sp. TaxID=2213 RepID=UPI002ABB7A08|nr:CRISPR-associated protein [Methanosarcina sp.]MDY9925984.1 CRISPR-associated protein [Methanosarcina sp.]
MKRGEIMMNNNENNSLKNRHETLFLWDVRKSNPNGDPNGNEPRIDRYTNKCDVMDVCIKRSVRNFFSTVNGPNSILINKLGSDSSETVTLTNRISDYLFGTPEQIEKTIKIVKRMATDQLKEDKQYKQFLESPSPKTLDGIINSKSKKDLEKIASHENVNVEALQNRIIAELRAYLYCMFYDLRMFGSILALENDLKALGGPITGPIQIEIGTSCHRVVQSNKQITSVMSSSDEKEAGIIGDTHCIEYGLFATSAIANENAARFTGLTEDDQYLFLKAIWRGTRERHTRSKNQVPRLLVDIEYNRPFHFGDLVNNIKLIPKINVKNGKPIEEESYRSIEDFNIDLTSFFQKINSKKDIINNIKFVSYDLISLKDFKEKLDAELADKVTEVNDLDIDSPKESK